MPFAGFLCPRIILLYEASKIRSDEKNNQNYLNAYGTSNFLF